METTIWYMIMKWRTPLSLQYFISWVESAHKVWEIILIYTHSLTSFWLHVLGHSFNKPNITYRTQHKKSFLNHCDFYKHNTILIWWNITWTSKINSTSCILRTDFSWQLLLTPQKLILWSNVKRQVVSRLVLFHSPVRLMTRPFQGTAPHNMQAV